LRHNPRSQVAKTIKSKLSPSVPPHDLENTKYKPEKGGKFEVLEKFRVYAIKASI